MDQTDKTPDIEIYIDHIALTDLVSWLNDRFDTVQPLKSHKRQHRFTASSKGQAIPILIFERVVDNFTSVWFDSPNTPWNTDKECAKDAHSSLNKEIRCTRGSWESAEDPNLWWSIGEKGEGEIIWQTQ